MTPDRTNGRDRREGDEEALAALERAGWDALSDGGASARRHFADLLVDDPLMVLPGGLVLDDRAQVLESMSGAPWETYDLEDVRVHALGSGAAVVAYGVRAQRGDLRYSALMTSTYVRLEDHWRLAVHQQTPR